MLFDCFTSAVYHALLYSSSDVCDAVLPVLSTMLFCVVPPVLFIMLFCIIILGVSTMLYYVLLLVLSTILVIGYAGSIDVGDGSVARCRSSN